MTIAHLGVSIVSAHVGKDWKAHTLEANICAGLICTPPVPQSPTPPLPPFHDLTLGGI